MDDAEQHYDNQGESSDKSADDDIKCEDPYRAGYTITEGNEPEAHPSDVKRKLDTEPHREVITYAVCHVDRLEEYCKAESLDFQDLSDLVPLSNNNL